MDVLAAVAAILCAAPFRLASFSAGSVYKSG